MMPPSLTTERLRSEDFWAGLLSDGLGYGRRRWRRIGTYRELVASGEVGELVAGYAAGTLAPQPPVRRTLNRSDGRKKVVFTFSPADELLLKALNRVLQPIVAGEHSRLCHSFQPGRGPRTAYRDLLRIPRLEELACLHVDVRDYFNSIPIEPLLASLPAVIVDDQPLRVLLSAILRDQRVISGDEVVQDPHKGVMAGTPLAPLLSNLYLRPLDRAFEGSGVAYLRYADDIVVFADVSEMTQHRDFIEQRLVELGLQLNPRKTRLSLPGEPWEFLGLRYERGSLDVAPNTVAKLRRRVRRIVRKARGRRDPAAYAVRRLNRRLYGVGGRPSDFTWAGWFFPLLNRDTTLRRIDALIQAQLRFAVTAAHQRRNFRAVSYADLRQAGYVPLVSAFHTYRRGVGEYEGLLAARAEVEVGVRATPEA